MKKETYQYHNFRLRFNNPKAIKEFKKIAIERDETMTNMVYKALESYYALPPFLLP